MKKLFLISFGIIYFTCAGAQTPQMTESQQTDTTAAAAASQALELLTQEQALRYQDSLSSALLKQQIENTPESRAKRILEEKYMRKHLDDSLRLEKLKVKIEASKKDATGYPIVVAGDTVRLIYTSFGTLTPVQRADISSNKIKSVAKRYIPSMDSLTVAHDGSVVEILFGETILTTVSQSDAIWENRDQIEIARDVAAGIHDAIVKYKKKTSFLAIAKQAGLSFLIVAAAVFLIWLVARGFRKSIVKSIKAKTGIWFKGLKIKDYQLLSIEKHVKLVLWIVKITRLLLVVTIIFLGLMLLFGVFPVTQRFAEVLWGWFFTPVKRIFGSIVDYLPKLFVVIIIWIIIQYVVKGLRYVMNEIGEGRLNIKGFYPEWAGATFNIFRFLLYTFGLIMIYPYLPGSESDIFKGVSIFVGLLVSFGSSSTIGNLISGLVITYMRPFKVGDHVKIGETTGDVLEKTPFVTRIMTYKKEVVTIPNNAILSASVVNYSTIVEEHKGVIFHVTISVGYDIPWRDVHKYLIEAALRSEFVMKEPAPFVLQTSLDDFYISYQICAYSMYPQKQASIYSQLNMNIQDVFNENRIEIMSPHYRAYRKGDATTTPDQYLKNVPIEDSTNLSHN